MCIVHAYMTALPSPSTSSVAVLPLSQLAPQPTQTISDTSSVQHIYPTLTDDLSLDQLMQIIRTPTPVQANPDTDTSTSSGIAPFQPKAVSTQQQPLSSPDVSPVVGAVQKHRLLHIPWRNTANSVSNVRSNNYYYGGHYTI